MVDISGEAGAGVDGSFVDETGYFQLQGSFGPCQTGGNTRNRHVHFCYVGKKICTITLKIPACWITGLDS